MWAPLEVAMGRDEEAARVVQRGARRRAARRRIGELRAHAARERAGARARDERCAAVMQEVLKAKTAQAKLALEVCARREIGHPRARVHGSPASCSRARANCASRAPRPLAPHRGLQT